MKLAATVAVENTVVEVAEVVASEEEMMDNIEDVVEVVYVELLVPQEAILHRFTLRK